MGRGAVVEADGPGGWAVGRRLRRLDAWAYRHPWRWGGVLAAYGFAAALESGRGQPLAVRLAVGAAVAAGWCTVGVLRRRQGPSPSGARRRRGWTAAFAALIALQALAGGLLRREPPQHAAEVSLTIFMAVLLTAEAVHLVVGWSRRRGRRAAGAAEEPAAGCPL